MLIAPRQTKCIFAVEVSVVISVLQKNITEQCIDFMVMLSSSIERKSNQRLQTNEEIGTSFKLKMLSQLLWVKSSRESSLNRECDTSGKSVVLSMCQRAFQSREYKLRIWDSYLSNLCSIWIIR